MTITIYTASDLKDRRVDVLGDATRDRALVRAVDGTALVMTRLEVVERFQAVSEWALELHRAERGAPGAQLRWLRHLDEDDRAECLGEFWDALEGVEAWSDGMSRLNELVAAWRATAQALADPERRRVLLGEPSPEDFVEATRPQ